MDLVDSHAHLDMYSADELPQVLSRAYAAGVHTILAIGIGDGPATMHRALDIALATNSPELPTVFATAGIHPQESATIADGEDQRLHQLLSHPRCVAVGEIGLDYYHVENPIINFQMTAFWTQMQLAAAFQKPIIIHCRTSELATPAAKEKFGKSDAWSDVLSMLNEDWRATGLGGIMHCFSGDLDHARRSLDLGFYLSFAGNVTYPAAQTIRDVAKYAPLDRILVETDSPFLAPIPLRGQRNEPAHVVHTAQFIAQLRGMSPDELAAQTTANFHRLFPATVATST